MQQLDHLIVFDSSQVQLEPLNEPLGLKSQLQEQKEFTYDITLELVLDEAVKDGNLVFSYSAR
jgi:hypothetical protein